ncbi:MAG: radical SAM family heme chaperone HemW [Gemmatimonadales bacterium]
MHLYVHVPFCGRRCSYCDFAIAVRRETPHRDFVVAVLNEWRGRLSAWRTATTIDTLYFGGGTPSRLAPDAIGELIRSFSADVPMAVDAEVTLEVNPDDVNAERADTWLAAGVNRLSLGVQTHDPSVLTWMHRTHHAQQVPAAMRILRAAGFRNISTDLIFGLPAALSRDWSADLDRTLGLEPQHISLYGLTIEPHTPLAHWTHRGAVESIPDEQYAAEYLLAHDRLCDAGFEHYEVSNAALLGYRSRHNAVYWSGADYLGLGPSAHSLLNGRREWNVREWVAYQSCLAAGRSAVAGSELLTPEARELEHCYLRLRTTAGLPVAELNDGTAQLWARERWAGVADGAVRLTAEGWLRLDALVGAARHS